MVVFIPALAAPLLSWFPATALGKAAVTQAHAMVLSVSRVGSVLRDAGLQGWGPSHW